MRAVMRASLDISSRRPGTASRTGVGSIGVRSGGVSPLSRALPGIGASIADADAIYESWAWIASRAAIVGSDLGEGRQHPARHQGADALGDREADAEAAAGAGELVEHAAGEGGQRAEVLLGDDMGELGLDAEVLQRVEAGDGARKAPGMRVMPSEIAGSRLCKDTVALVSPAATRLRA